MILLPTSHHHAASTLPSSFVAVTTTKKGTMNWGRMICLMLPNSTTAVGLRTLRRLAAPPIFMSLMMKTDCRGLEKERNIKLKRMKLKQTIQDEHAPHLRMMMMFMCAVSVVASI